MEKPLITLTADKNFKVTFLTYTGAFMFAIIFIILVHELGHMLAYFWRGYDDVVIRLNPFMGVTSFLGEIQNEDVMIIVLGGTVFNLTVGSLFWIILHCTKSPYWIPLKMVSATAYLIEGMVILAGLFFKETVTDFSWLISFGWSPFLVGLIGFIFINIGGLLTYKVWIMSGIKQKTSRKLIFFLNGPFVVYCLLGFLFGQIMVPIDWIFIKRFLGVALILHWLYIGLRIYFAPRLLPRIRERMGEEFPMPTKNASKFSLTLGFAAWSLSLLVLN